MAVSGGAGVVSSKTHLCTKPACNTGGPGFAWSCKGLCKLKSRILKTFCQNIKTSLTVGYKCIEK